MTHIEFMNAIIESIGESEIGIEFEDLITSIQGHDIASIAMDSGSCGSIVFCMGEMHFSEEDGIWKASANSIEESDDNYVWVIDSTGSISEGGGIDFSKKFEPGSEEYEYIMMLLDTFRL